MLVTQLDNNGYFVCLCDDYGGSMPHGCIANAPPPFPWSKVWARWTGKKWEMVPDHRQRRVEEGFAPELVQEATEYWLPEDTHQSPARYMTDIGPLPEGVVLDKPRKTHDDLATDLRSQRDSRIAATDYLMAADYPLDDAQRAAWAAYRQALRDMPQAEGFPWDGGGELTPWPVRPE